MNETEQLLAQIASALYNLTQPGRPYRDGLSFQRGQRWFWDTPDPQKIMLSILPSCTDSFKELPFINLVPIECRAHRKDRIFLSKFTWPTPDTGKLMPTTFLYNKCVSRLGGNVEICRGITECRHSLLGVAITAAGLTLPTDAISLTYNPDAGKMQLVPIFPFKTS